VVPEKGRKMVVVVVSGTGFFYKPDALPVTQQKCQGTKGKAKL